MSIYIDGLSRKNPVIARKRSDSVQTVWPMTGSATPDIIGDVFGPRPFSPHIATVGYDYDYHRGIDCSGSYGDPVYCIQDGYINRYSYSHYDLKYASHSSSFDLQGTYDISEIIAASGFWHIQTSTSNDFANAAKVVFNTQIDQSNDLNVRSRVVPSGSTDFSSCGVFIRSKNDNTNYIVGYIQTGPAGSYLGLEITASGSTSIPYYGQIQTDPWPGCINLEYQQANDTVKLWHGSNWSSLSVIHADSFSLGDRQCGVFVRPSGATSDIYFERIEYSDQWGLSSRHGNSVFVLSPFSGQDYCRWIYMHLSKVVVNCGQRIKRGDLLGYIGDTGFSSRSGPILSPHLHLDFQPQNPDGQKFWYDLRALRNPLTNSSLPRFPGLQNDGNNISYVSASGNDPDGGAAHQVTVTVTRNAQQEFDFNYIACSGNLSTGEVNFDLRLGLNDDHDIPKVSGVYIVPQSFNQQSATYVCDFYFEHSTYGATLNGVLIMDSAGNIYE